MVELVSLGVLYGDKRTGKALKKLNPDIVTVEMSNKYWKELSEKGFSSNFAEVSECINYCRVKEIPLFFIDKPISKVKISKNIEKMKNFDKKQGLKTREIYSFFENLYDKYSSESEKVLDNSKDFKSRTRYMSDKLEKILSKNKSFRIVHVGGAGHFLKLRNIETLFSVMKKHRLQRFLISQLI